MATMSRFYVNPSGPLKWLKSIVSIGSGKKSLDETNETNLQNERIRNVGCHVRIFRNFLAQELASFVRWTSTRVHSGYVRWTRLSDSLTWVSASSGGPSLHLHCCFSTSSGGPGSSLHCISISSFLRIVRWTSCVSSWRVRWINLFLFIFQMSAAGVSVNLFDIFEQHQGPASLVFLYDHAKPGGHHRPLGAMHLLKLPVGGSASCFELLSHNSYAHKVIWFENFRDATSCTALHGSWAHCRREELVVTFSYTGLDCYACSHTFRAESCRGADGFCSGLPCSRKV